MLSFGVGTGLVFGGCVLAGREWRFLGKIVYLYHLEAKSGAVKSHEGFFGPSQDIGSIFFHFECFNYYFFNIL